MPTNAQSTMTTKTASITPATSKYTQDLTDVDIEKILNEKNLTSGQMLNWRSSIVDLLKLLDIDCSLRARNALAAELDYNGNIHHSSRMNIWLHRQVMNKLAANGGKVPAELRD